MDNIFLQKWWVKILQIDLLLKMNLKIAFNTVRVIISTLLEIDRLEKGCFGLNVFVQLSS